MPEDYQWSEFVVACNCGNQVYVAGLDREHESTCDKCSSKVWVRITKDKSYQPMVFTSRKLERTMKMAHTHAHIINFIC